VTVKRTGNAVVGELEIRGEIAVTRPRGVQNVVGHRRRAVPTSRADGVQVAAHVHRTAEVAEAGADAAAEAHASVAGLPYDDHLVVGWTGQIQCFHRTVLRRRRRRRR